MIRGNILEGTWAELLTEEEFNQEQQPDWNSEFKWAGPGHYLVVVSFTSLNEIRIEILTPQVVLKEIEGIEANVRKHRETAEKFK